MERSALHNRTMDTNALAIAIAAKVAADTSFWVAIVGLVGVILGALIAAVGNVVLHWIQARPRKKLDKVRKALLKQMLDDEKHPGKWRKIETLSRVIGADEESTKCLLMELGARGSEKDDGLWGLIEHHPLGEVGR